MIVILEKSIKCVSYLPFTENVRQHALREDKKHSKEMLLKRKDHPRFFENTIVSFHLNYPTNYWNCKFQKALNLILASNSSKLSYPNNELYIFKAYIYLKWMLIVFRGHQEVQRGLQLPKVLIFSIDFIITTREY